MTHAELSKMFRGTKTSKKLGNNTYAIKNSDGSIAVRLHTTDILTFNTDNTITVKTGGWHTVTTKARINEYLPANYIYQKNYGWFWKDGTVFNEGDTVDVGTGEVLTVAVPY